MSLISIIIPCYNGANYLKEAIESINNQKMNTEIIVVDDGSTDNTAELAQQLGARVFSIPSSGLSTARNVGLKHVNGEYVMFLDHDDLIAEGALEILYHEFKKDNELQYVQAKLKDFVSPELSDADKKLLSPRNEPYGGVVPGAILFRKEVMEIIGGFDENLKTGQGVEFLLRCEKYNLKTLKLDFISAKRRLHNTNMGLTMRQQESKDYASLLRARLVKK